MRDRLSLSLDEGHKGFPGPFSMLVTAAAAAILMPMLLLLRFQPGVPAGTTSAMTLMISLRP
jgi:hypothetical protein